MTYLKFFLAITALVSTVYAESVSVNIDGRVYTCTAGGSGAADPACVRELTDYCDKSTSNTSSQCFEKSSYACKGAPAGMVKCVMETTEYCSKKTSSTSSQCFEIALKNCR